VSITGGEAGFPAVREAREAMATRFEVVLPGNDQVRLLAAAEEALDDVERLEAQLSLYRDRSEISGINARAAEGPVPVEPRLFALLILARALWEVTDGAFDPTIAPLLRAWGFVGGGGRRPRGADLAAARQVSGFRYVHLDRDQGTVRFTRTGVCLDLGAIGKGYAVDTAVETLRFAGVESALVHAGTSSVFALGAPPGADAWRVALRDPRGDAGTVLGWVDLRDRALSVSAPHGKAFREGDRLYGHVLDPRSGRPTRGTLLAAVSHPTASLTDAVSTGLLVQGAGGPARLSGRLPDTDFLVLLEDGRIETAGPDSWRLSQVASG
jgi:thiamine biosynthesis lipoprotein